MPHISLVLDQSTSCTGAAIVTDDPARSIGFGIPGGLLWHGRILPPNDAQTLDRVRVMCADVSLLIERYSAAELVLENTNWKQPNSGASNALGALFLGLKELAARKGLALYLQNPKTIKSLFAADGRATKDQVIEAVTHKWGIPRSRILDHNHADALAGAWVWLYRGAEVRAKRAGNKRHVAH